LPDPPNWPDRSVYKGAEEDTPPSTSGDGNGHDFEENKYKEMIFGEDALKIPPSESYCLSRPIRRGHFNVSHNYSLHQVGNQINARFFS
jgi:actin-related protein 8